MPQVVAEKTVGASYGDAFLAALAIGAVSRSDIARWNPPEGTIRPRPRHAEIYRRQYSVFRRLYTQTRDLMAELS